MAVWSKVDFSNPEEASQWANEIAKPPAWNTVGYKNNPDFENGWVNYSATFNSCQFYKDLFSNIYLRGMVRSGTVGQDIFTLPREFRPMKKYLFDVQSDDALGRVDITNNGKVTATNGNNAWLSLDGIMFSTT